MSTAYYVYILIWLVWVTGCLFVINAYLLRSPQNVSIMVHGLYLKVFSNNTARKCAFYQIVLKEKDVKLHYQAFKMYCRHTV